jgi:hypothetical protein
MNMAFGGLRFIRAASIIGVVLVAAAFGTRTLGQYDRPPPAPCGVPYKTKTVAKLLDRCDWRATTCRAVTVPYCWGSCYVCDRKGPNNIDFIEDRTSKTRYIIQDVGCPGTYTGECVDTDPSWFFSKCACIPVKDKKPTPNDCNTYKESDPANDCNPPKI